MFVARTSGPAGGQSWLSTLFCLLAMAALAAPGLTDDGQQAAARAYNAAAALQNTELHERAAARWAEFIQAFPQDQRLDRAFYYLGICQLRTQKYQEAAKSFQTVLQRWPGFAHADGAQYNLGMALYELALASQQKQDFQKAAAALATVTQKYATSDLADEALYFQADCSYHSGDLRAAITLLEKLIRDYPQSGQLARAYYDLSIAQQETGATAEAGKTMESFLARQEFLTHPLAPEIRVRWALLLYDQQQLEASAKQFEEVSRSKDAPLADFAMLRHGQCLLEMGKPEEAAKILKELPGRFPESDYRAAAQTTCGRCYHLTENWAEAQKMLEPAAAGSDAVAAEAAWWLGRTHLKAGDPNKAFQSLDSAVGRFPEGEFAGHLRLARIDAMHELPEQRKQAPALYRELAQGLKDHPLAPQALYMAALSALDQAEYAAARDAAELFVQNRAWSGHELYPAVLHLAAEGTLLADQENAASRTKAEQYYRQLVERFPEHPGAARSYLRIAWCLLQAGKPQATIDYLQTARGRLNQAEHQAEAHFLTGRGHAAQQRHREAVTACQAAMDAAPAWQRRDEVLLAAAESLLSLAALDDAAARLSVLTKEHAESSLLPQALYQLGEIARHQEKDDQAIQYFTQVVDGHASSDVAGFALYGLGAVHFARQEDAPAAAWLDRLIGLASADALLVARGRHLRGLTCQRQGEFAKAAEHLSAFLSSNPEPADALNARYALALCQIGMNQFDQASGTLAEILKQKADCEHADKIYYEMGHALLAHDGRQAEAAAAFQTLAEKRPDSPLAPESWFRVGDHHESLARTAEDQAVKAQEIARAQTAYTAGLSKGGEPELREKLRYKLGDLQLQAEKYAEAGATFTAQLKDHPRGEYAGAARFLAAESFYRQGRCEQALPLYVGVLDDKFSSDEQAASFRAQALYRAGDCAAKLNNWKESENRYGQLIQQFPKFSQISEGRYGLALALHRQNQWDRATEVYQQVTAETETETAAKARFMIGEICFAQKKYEDAIEHFLLVSAGYAYPEWQALGRFETGRCFAELGDKQRADRAFQEMIALHPEHPRTEDARRMREQLAK